MLNMLLAEGAANGQQPGAMDLLGTFWPFLLVIVVVYFFMVRPQKKRDKALQDMRSNIEIADEIVTVGGIIGRVVSIRDDSLVIETGSDRSKIRISKWAVQTNNTAHERVDAEKKSKKEKDKDKDAE